MVIDGQTLDCSVAIGNAYSASVEASEQVRLQGWYCKANENPNKAWKYVARINNEAAAEYLADSMVSVCHNNYVRYSQTYRGQLYNYVKNGGAIGDISQIIYCDCSSLICALLYNMGVHVNLTSSDGLYNELTKTNLFTIFSDTNVCNESASLIPGDIVWREHYKEWDAVNQQYVDHDGHAFIVVASEYYENSEYYINNNTKNRAQYKGRYMPRYASSDIRYVSDGVKKVVSGAPKDLSEMSDLQLFMLGAFITGGEGVAIHTNNPAKHVILTPN